MIFDQLSKAKQYESLHPLFAEAFAYLRTFDTSLKPGTYEIKGKDLYAMVQAFESGDPTGRKFESHRKYIDIQYVFRGEEVMQCAPSEDLQVETPYSEEKEVVFYMEAKRFSPVRVQAGEFTIFYPQDGHKPGCWVEKSSPVGKVVLKIRI